MPATLATMSSFPQAFTAPSTIDVTAAGSDTSQRTARASPPAAAMVATVSSAPFMSSSRPRRRDARSFSARTVAGGWPRPILELDPVTIATRPSNRFISTASVQNIEHVSLRSARR